MTKPVAPGSLEDAVGTIHRACGVPACAEVARVSARMIYAWSDETDPRRPCWVQCLALETLYMQTVQCTRGPILSSFVSYLSHLSAPHEVGDPLDRLADASKEHGEGQAAFREWHRAPTRNTAYAAQKELVEEIEAAQAKLRDVQTWIKESDGEMVSYLTIINPSAAE